VEAVVIQYNYRRGSSEHFIFKGESKWTVTRVTR
jgi:hypothetical protein